MRNNRHHSIFIAACAITATLLSGSFAFAQDAQAESGGVAGVASRAVLRMQETVKKADTLATQGAQLQTNGMNKEAMEAYQQAFEIIPGVPATEQRRLAYFQRYQSASAAYAQTLVDQAEYEKAQTVLTNVYRSAGQTSDIPPTAISGEVSSLLKKLKDDHFNRAMTPGHLKRVSDVERLLKTAQGAIDLGDYDKAETLFNQVLATDPYNSASRRGLETVERLRLKYHDASRDYTRSKMLGEVSKGWVLPVPVDLSEGVDSFKYSDALLGSNKASIEVKLKNLDIPRVEFQEARLADVLTFLTQKSQELDVSERDPGKRGVNFIVNGAEDADERLVTIQLSNIPLGAALTYIGQKVGMKYRVDEFAVTLIPINSTEDEAMVNRTYTVPPDFLSSGSGDGAGAGVADDPFADPSPAGGGATPVSRLSAQEFLEQSGVNFDTGSSASFNPRTSVLTVRNRPSQLEIVEALVASSRESVPKIIQIDFRMISISTSGATELGFNWLLGPSNVGSTPKLFTSGGTASNASQNRNASDFPFVDPSTGLPIGGNPITAGLRSGNTRGNLSIDDVIARAAPTDPTRPVPPAPAVFGISGVFTDPQFQTVIRALNQSKATDRLCEASVVVRPGERASIRQIREFIYPTEYDPPELPNSVGIVQANVNGQQGGIDTGVGNSFPVTPATPTAFETRELGKIIEVEPVVGPDNQTVSLNIATEISDFVGFVNYGTPISTIGVGALGPEAVVITENRILMPVFDAVKENTNVTVWDSQTIAIGGLVQDDIDEIEDKVPFLGDIPLIGRAFRSKVTDRKKRGMVMFVTVRILDPSGLPVNQAVGTNQLPNQ